MLARKFANCRLGMAGVRQNALFLLWFHKAGKILVRLDQNEEKTNIKK